MTNAEVLELDIWKGDWGLSSVDIECLQVLVCTRSRLWQYGPGDLTISALTFN